VAILFLGCSRYANHEDPRGRTLVRYQLKILVFSCNFLFQIIYDSSLIEKDPKRKKVVFIAMRPTQKCESIGFQTTWDSAFEPIYFLLRRVCYTIFAKKLEKPLTQ
jgi:hypothetical protein